MGGGPLGRLRDTVTEAADNVASATRSALVAAVVLAAAAFLIALAALGIAVRRPRHV